MAKELNITAIRMRERMEETGWTQEGLADAVNATQGAISQIITGTSRKSRLLPLIAEKLAVNLNWLLGVTDEKIDMFNVEGEQISEDTLAGIKAGIIDNILQKPVQMKQASEPIAATNDTVDIAEFNVAYGLGGAFLHDAPAQQTRRTFSRVWVRQFTDAPFDRLFWATGSGTSMMPAILDNDILLIDTMQQSPRMWDQLWAIEMHGLGMIKSLRPSREGGMRIISLNPDYPEEVAYDGEMNVIGRVVAIVRKV